MSTALSVLTEGPASSSCWNSIGVKGDRSCVELATHVHCHNCPKFAAGAQSFLERQAPAGYITELTSLLRNNAEPRDERGQLSVLIIESCEQLFGVPTRSVVEVTALHAVHRVPHRTNQLFAGVVNIDGHLELAASLEGLLRISAPRGREPTGSQGRMVLVEHRGQRWAVAVDAALGVSRFSAEEHLAAPTTAQQDSSAHIKTLLRWGEVYVALLDLDSVCGALERAVR